MFRTPRPDPYDVRNRKLFYPMSSRRPRQKQRRRSLADLLQDSKLNPPAPREKRYQSRPPIATSPAAPTASKSSTTTRLPVLKTTDRKPQREPGIFPKKKGALNKSTMKKKVLFNEAPQPPVNQCAPPMDKKRLYELEKKLGSLEKEISRAKYVRPSLSILFYKSVMNGRASSGALMP